MNFYVRLIYANLLLDGLWTYTGSKELRLMCCDRDDNESKYRWVEGWIWVAMNERLDETSIR